jgi:hypothetical protein
LEIAGFFARRKHATDNAVLKNNCIAQLKQTFRLSSKRDAAKWCKLYITHCKQDAIDNQIDYKQPFQLAYGGDMTCDPPKA